jgi:hypothetical protein
VKTRPMNEDSGATCDWGHCDRETVAERWDLAGEQWLAVCYHHGPRQRRASPGRGRCARCGSEYALLVDGTMRLHNTRGFMRCPGSGQFPKEPDVPA